jgi:hypothetical protein
LWFTLFVRRARLSLFHPLCPPLSTPSWHIFIQKESYFLCCGSKWDKRLSKIDQYFMVTSFLLCHLTRHTALLGALGSALLCSINSFFTDFYFYEVAHLRALCSNVIHFVTVVHKSVIYCRIFLEAPCIRWSVYMSASRLSTVVLNRFDSHLNITLFAKLFCTFDYCKIWWQQNYIFLDICGLISCQNLIYGVLCISNAGRNTQQ